MVFFPFFLYGILIPYIINNKKGPEIIISKSFSARRHDLTLLNSSNNRLYCSYFEPIDPRTLTPFPLSFSVLYLHSNSGSRLEALPLLQVLISKRISLFCFDFAGSGISEGENISLGFNEKNDVALILDYMRNRMFLENIVIWGRSMGATTALLYDYKVSFLILDSPFYSLRNLIEEMGKEQMDMPYILIKPLVLLLNTLIRRQEGFDFDDIDLKDRLIKGFKSPLILLTSNKDKVVKKWHGDMIFKEYNGDKKRLELSLEHNEERPEKLIKEVIDLVLVKIIKEKTCFIDFNDKYNIIKPKIKGIQLTHKNLQKHKENISLMSEKIESMNKAQLPFNKRRDQTPDIQRNPRSSILNSKREPLTPYKIQKVVIQDELEDNGEFLSFEKENPFCKDIIKNIKKPSFSTTPSFKRKLIHVLGETKIKEIDNSFPKDNLYKII